MSNRLLQVDKQETVLYLPDPLYYYKAFINIHTINQGMLFHSLEFAIFAIAFYTLWLFARRSSSLRRGFLVAASFLFYGWWDWRYIILILVSGLIDYYSALGIHRSIRHRKLFLVLSIIGNLLVLGVFKYLNFIVENINSASSFLSLGFHLPASELVLPIGISFYTFQSMSYTIDVYRGKLEPTTSVMKFFAYLSLFPQLIAGPIVRATELLHQMDHPAPVDETRRWEGTRLVVSGFFKKVVIADSIVPVVDLAFSRATGDGSWLFWIVVALLFRLQIYYDFSGYSDIARGLSKWMGYEIPFNFNFPYFSLSFSDYWRRWHLTMSSWFRDYVYIPLGGSRVSRMRTQLNILITFLLSGLWHGAAWNFVAWGLVNGLYICVERLLDWQSTMRRNPLGVVVSAIWFHFGIVITGILFRSNTLEQAVNIIVRICTFSGNVFDGFNMLPGIVFFYYLAGWMFEMVSYYAHKYPGFFSFRIFRSLEPAAVAALVFMCIFMRGPGSTFIYYQF